MELSILRVFLFICLTPWFVFSYVRIPKKNIILKKTIRHVRDAESISFVNVNNNNEESEEIEEVSIEMIDYITPIHYRLEYNIDVEEQQLGGSVEIELKCKSHIDVIGIAAKELIINPKTLSLYLKGSSKKQLISESKIESGSETLVLNLHEDLESDKLYTLKLDFEKTAESAKKFFNKYVDQNGLERKFAVLPTSDAPAMEIFPCFEGYGMEATFDVTIVRPKHLQSASNTEIIKQEPRSDDRVADIYYKSPILNPNNINVIVSDFAYTEQLTTRGVKIRVWAPKHKLGLTKLAANISVHSLQALETYFNSQIPHNKIDFFPIPDLPAAGISTYGIIMCGEQIIYIDQKSTLDEKKYSANILTHETSHQWFGAMIESIDSENSWITEAFANFISNEIMEKISPEWKVDESFVLSQMHPSMKVDATFLSHPLTVPASITTKDDDFTDLAIAYFKGSCVFRTIKAGMGEKAFVNGIQVFVKKFLFKQASADDIWQALSEAAVDSEAKDEDFKAVAHTWTLQMGYPVVKIDRNYDNGQTNITQEHFVDPASPFRVNNRFPNLGYKWSLPITYITGNDMNWNNPKRFWLHDSTNIYNDMVPDSNEWILANVNSGGYYRVNYDAHNWLMLSDQLNLDYSKITPINRASLFDDAFNLANFGFLSINTALDFTTYIGIENDFLPFETMIDNLQILHDKFADTKMRENMQKYLIPKLQDKYATFDWESLPTNTLNRTTREKLFKFVCDLKIDHCVKTTRNKLKRFLFNYPQNKINQLRSLVLCFGIKYGTSQDWDDIYKAAESDSSLMDALTCTNDLEKIQRLIEIVFVGEVPDSEQFYTLLELSKNPKASKLVFTAVKNNWDLLLNGNSGEDFMKGLPYFVQNLNSAADLKQLKALENKYKNHAKWKQSVFMQSLDTLSSNIQWIKFNKEAARGWLNYAVSP